MFFLKGRKKRLTTIATVVVSGASILWGVNALYADATGSAGGDATIFLQEIAQYTNGILTAVTSTSNPVVQAIVIALTNLTSPDNATDPATPTPNLQNAFTSYVGGAAKSATNQLALQASLNQTFFGSGVTAATLPNANDLTFSTILGSPYFSPDPRSSQTTVNPPLNYIQNLAGTNISHPLPSPNWKGNAADQTKYINYYNTVSAIQTFNNYILSQIYEDLSTGLSALQTTLINQASDPKAWFAVITNESIGAVLRQTLMFESQSYILLTQMLQTQKLILAAQGANISMQLIGSSTNESILLRRAITPAAVGT